MIADVDWRDDEIGTVHLFNFDLVDSGGIALARGSVSIQPEPADVPGLPAHSQLAVPMNVQVTSQQMLHANLGIDGNTVLSLPLWVFSQLPAV